MDFLISYNNLKQNFFNREIVCSLDIDSNLPRLLHISRQIVNSRCEAKEKSSSLEILAIGSSHGLYGFNSNHFHINAINCSGVSQDLRISLQIYKQIANSSPNLKKVFLFYSVFSNGFNLELSSDEDLSACYKVIWDIDYYLEENTKKYKTLEKELLKKSFIKKCKKSLCELSYLDKTDEILKSRIKSHLAHNKRSSSMHEYLEEMIELSKLNNHELVVVIPPCSEKYRSLMLSSEELFKDLYEELDSDIKILNFYEDEHFNESDFGDFDHLNEQGAIKLINKLDLSHQ